jgi:hypothetical protein
MTEDLIQMTFDHTSSHTHREEFHGRNIGLPESQGECQPANGQSASRIEVDDCCDDLDD